jgi:DNA polymerase III delta subunit
MAQFHPELFREAGDFDRPRCRPRALCPDRAETTPRSSMKSQKLLSYAGGTPIDLKIVAEMVTPKLDDDAFHLSNALTRGDIESALRIYRDLKVHSAEEITLINLLAGQFRYMDMVRFLDAKGLDSSQIARELGGSPIRADITVRNLYRIKEASLLRIQEQLYQLDYEILSGHQDPEFAFQLFLANFTL